MKQNEVLNLKEQNSIALVDMAGNGLMGNGLAGNGFGSTADFNLSDIEFEQLTKELF